MQLKGKLSEKNLRVFLQDEVLDKYNLLFKQANDDLVSSSSLDIEFDIEIDMK